MKPRGGSPTVWEEYHSRHRGTKPCGCSICRTSRALRDLEQSLEERMEREDERDMRLAYLLDEVEAVVRSPWSAFVRKRLRKALASCR